MKIDKRIVWGSLVVLMGVFSPRAVTAQQNNNDKPYKEDLILVEGKLRTGDFGGALASLDELITKYPAAAEAYYAKALLYGQARNFEIAIPIAKQALTLDPNNLMYANYLLELYKGNRDLNGALETIDTVLQRFPENEVLYREKIMLLHNGKRSDEALSLYDETVGKFGVSDILDAIKGEILVDIQRSDDAEKLLLPWVSKKSKIRQIYSTLGYIYLEQKNVKAAVQVLEKGVANSSDNLLYLDLADAYAASKKNKQSFEALKKAFDAPDVDFADKYRVMMAALGGKTSLDLAQTQELANSLVLRYPRVADSHIAKAQVSWRRGNLQEARSLFLTAISMNKGHIDAWRMLMNVDLALNLPDDAIAHGFEAMAANPNNATLMYFTGLAYQVKDDTANARKMLEAALDNSGEDIPYLQSLIYASLGDLYHKLNLVDISDVAYEEAIKLDSTNANAMNNYAYYLSERNEKLEHAAELSKTSNILEPGNAAYQDTYAWILFKQGDYKEALKWMGKAMVDGHQSGLYHAHYGDILFKLGNSKEAVKSWEKALAMGDLSEEELNKLKIKIESKNYVE